MAAAVVDELEGVEVDDRERERLTSACGHAVVPPSGDGEPGAVEQACQAVGVRRGPQARVESGEDGGCHPDHRGDGDPDRHGRRCARRKQAQAECRDHERGVEPRRVGPEEERDVDRGPGVAERAQPQTLLGGRYRDHDADERREERDRDAQIDRRDLCSAEDERQGNGDADETESTKTPRGAS
jgi:hypothetical protein